MNLITLDFETYFSDDYTLKKLSTEEYIRDPRFKAHLVGVKFGERPAVDCQAHLLHENQDLRRQIETSAVIAHHAHFDGLILSHHYNLRPAFWIDTLSMARATVRQVDVGGSLAKLLAHFGLSGKTLDYAAFKGVRDLPHALYCQVAEGCKQDVDQTYALFKKLRPAVPDDEMRVIDQTVRMFTEPILGLDRPRLSKFLAAEKIRKARLMLAVGTTLGLAQPRTVDELRAFLEAVETELQSAEKFRVALESLGYACPMKWSEKQQCDIPALAKNDDGMKELLDHDDDRVSALAGARLGVKSTIDETRAERLLAASQRGPLPVYLAYGAAKTLRFGGGDKTNWQNFRRGGEIRKSVVAPDGYKLVIVDASQVECRGLNWMAGENWVCEAFAEGRDIYSETASRNLGWAVNKKDHPLERFGGKTLELGCGFGLGWRKYQRQMRAGMLGGPSVTLTDEEAQRGVTTYRTTHPKVVAMWRLFGEQFLPALASGAELQWGCLEIAEHKIWLPNGMSLDYTGLHWGYFGATPAEGEEPQWWAPSRKGKSKYYGGKLVENVVQALFSGLLIREAMVRIGARYRIVLQVHDEIVFLAPDDEAEAALAFGLAELRRLPDWADDRLPLDAEGLVSERYEK